MPGGVPCQLWPMSRRQPITHHCLSQSVRNASNNKWTTPHHKPQPVQLLRFALTENTRKSPNNESGLSLHFKELFSENWPLNASPPPPLWSLQQNVTRAYKGIPKPKAEDLGNLRHYIMKNVNGREEGEYLQANRCRNLAKALELCQRHHTYQQILSTINGLIARLLKQNVPLSRHLFVLGMYYSSMAFSETALSRHLQGYISVSRDLLDLESSISLVNNLLFSLQSLESGLLPLDTRLMCNLITGEGASEEQPSKSLHSILYWANPDNAVSHIGLYLTLLATLRSDELLQQLWNKTLEKLSQNSPAHDLESVYSCVVALVNVGDSSKALAYLLQLSNRLGRVLPGISKFEGLNTLLEDQSIGEQLPLLAGQEEWLNIVDVQLERIEGRLGICWQPKKSLHSDISDSDCIVTENPLFDINGESTGYDSSDRLVAEIKALGGSKSAGDLGKIADLLDDQEGCLVPIVPPSTKKTSLEFSWYPKRCAIKFSNTSALQTDVSKTCPDLGLFRARLGRSKISPATQYPLRAIQLGYLLMRDQSFKGKPYGWEETDYIVAWDRDAGQFILVYAGKGHDQAFPSTGFHDTDTNPLFDRKSLARLVPLEALRKPNDRKSWLEVNSSMCYLETDPGLDLVD
ncbi:uncharacterized protein ATNIH1004_004755 [Aspergillus tanneri]|uniref:Uncharacterized protein n=1 Tax=Aspergillus tanneri TaxID=1220188 RepID=A0A5M9MWA1_9EURO|nr:uncharacterized protein ATNIH1004_004755 [Aspergillus tanneri]KAA8648869.1 hypothetical protein ATNIH1004_004755 [Aspergillus tanneri]